MSLPSASRSRATATSCAHHRLDLFQLGSKLRFHALNAVIHRLDLQAKSDFDRRRCGSIVLRSARPIRPPRSPADGERAVRSPRPRRVLLFEPMQQVILARADGHGESDAPGGEQEILAGPRPFPDPGPGSRDRFTSVGPSARLAMSP